MPVTEHRKRLAATVRRRQILDESARLFVGQGFEAVRMADIAQALGISRPAIYSYFASTEAVLDDLLGERLTQLWAHLELLLPAHAPGQHRPTRGLFADLFRFLLGERETLLLLHCGGGPAFQVRRNAFLGELGQRLDAQSPNVLRRPYQMSIVTQLLGSVAHSAVQQGLNDTDQLASTLDSFMTAGVAALSAEAGRVQPSSGEI